jgi:hypothetical protein
MGGSSSPTARVVCPHCQTAVRVPDVMFGKTVACPSCKGTMSIAPSKTPRQAAAGPCVKIRCPNCDEALRIAVDALGKEDRCPACDYVFVPDSADQSAEPSSAVAPFHIVSAAEVTQSSIEALQKNRRFTKAAFSALLLRTIRKKLNVCIALAVMSAVLAVLIPRSMTWMEQAKMVAVVRNAREAMENDDYDAFVLHVDRRWSQETFRSVRENDSVRDALLPDLESDVDFIKVMVDGDWAGYYFKADLDDPEYLTVQVLLFRKCDGQWRVCGTGLGRKVPRPDNSARGKDGVSYLGDEEQIERELADPSFQIEPLKKRHQAGGS